MVVRRLRKLNRLLAALLLLLGLLLLLDVYSTAIALMAVAISSSASSTPSWLEIAVSSSAAAHLFVSRLRKKRVSVGSVGGRCGRGCHCRRKDIPCGDRRGREVHSTGGCCRLIPGGRLQETRWGPRIKRLLSGKCLRKNIIIISA